MIPWTGVGFCCIGAAAFYFHGRSYGRDAEFLRSVTRVNQLKDLAVLLDTAGKVLPLFVTVSGRVGSDSPIHCERSGLKGVLLEETAEQDFLKRNKDGSWIQESALLLSTSKEVPWYLNDGTGRVFVVGAQNAAGLALTVSQVFEKSRQSLSHETKDSVQGIKMLGFKRTESVLPMDTPLTVVGEAIKDDIGTIQIQRPHEGPFFVTPENIDQLITNHGSCSRWCKFASMGFIFFGVYLLAKYALQHILERKWRWEYQKRVLASASQEGQDTEDDKSASSPDNAKRDRLIPDICVICLEQEYNVVFIPCGHLCCCTNCSLNLSNCPLCQRRIDQAVKTFRH